MHPLRTGLAAAAALGLLLPALAPPASATPPTAFGEVHARAISASTGCQAPRAGGVVGDVNGDGYADLAVGEPGDRARRGSVHLFYGYRGALQVDAKKSARNDLALTQASKGVPGTSEPGDHFGAATLLSDVNGDGCADLVVGVPGEDDGTGAITVLYGSPRGLRTSGAQQLKSTILFRPTPDRVRGLGATMTSGDFDGDGIADIAATGLKRESANGLTYDLPASVVIVYGNGRGLGRGRAAALMTPDSLALPDRGMSFGNALTSGDYDGDGDAELAVGTRDGVQLVQRRGQALVAGAAITASTPGFPGRTSDYVSLGSSLATGDVQADGFDDLIVGDQDYGLGEPESEYGKGAVVLLPGSSSGPTTVRSQFWTQASPGVQGQAAYGNEFGAALAVGRLDAGPTDDLVVGAPGYGAFDDSVTVLLGAAKGLTTAGLGGTQYTQSTRGIPGSSESGDAFGRTVAVAALDGRNPGAVIIGAPRENVGRISDAGAITQLGSSAKGPDPRNSRVITLNTAGVRGTAAANDRFGDALS